MDRGTYVSASGGLQSARQIQVVANNLANVNTVGFKAQRLVSRQQEFGDTLASQLGETPARAFTDQQRIPGVTDIETITDFSPGPIATTGNPFDVALRRPDEFFVVQTPAGEQYTRAGNFTIDSAGQITTADGMPVVGTGGPLVIPPGIQPVITATGALVGRDGEIGRLRIVRAEDPQKMVREGLTRFSAGEAQMGDTPAADLVPQSLEMANISAVDAMIQMMTAQRSFEAYTKTITTIDELNSSAIRFVRSV